MIINGELKRNMEGGSRDSTNSMEQKHS